MDIETEIKELKRNAALATFYREQLLELKGEVERATKRLVEITKAQGVSVSTSRVKKDWSKLPELILWLHSELMGGRVQRKQIAEKCKEIIGSGNPNEVFQVLREYQKSYGELKTFKEGKSLFYMSGQ